MRKDAKGRIGNGNYRWHCLQCNLDSQTYGVEYSYAAMLLCNAIEQLTLWFNLLS